MKQCSVTVIHREMPGSDLDCKVESLAKSLGCELAGGGYCFLDGERDLEFGPIPQDKVNGVVGNFRLVFPELKVEVNQWEE